MVRSPLRDSVQRLTRCPGAPPREVQLLRQAVPKYIYEQGLQAARLEFHQMTEPELKSTDFSMFPEARLRVAPTAGSTTDVRIVDIRMPFGSMVLFMIEWSLAEIPAAIILLCITAAFAVSSPA